jgi:hypothetical protein
MTAREEIVSKLCRFYECCNWKGSCFVVEDNWAECDSVIKTKSILSHTVNGYSLSQLIELAEGLKPGERIGKMVDGFNDNCINSHCRNYYKVFQPIEPKE